MNVPVNPALRVMESHVTKLTNVPMVLIHVIIMLHVPILLEASPVAAMLVSAVMAQFALTLTSVSLELIVRLCNLIQSQN